MITFELKDVIAEGVAIIKEDKTLQNTTLVISIVGLPNEREKLLTEPVSFQVDTSLSIADAWADIKNQALEWFNLNYK